MIYVSLIVLLMACGAYWLLRKKARGLIGKRVASKNKLHSLPFYHGCHGFLMVLLPAFFVLGLWSMLSHSYLEHQVQSKFATAITQLAPAQKDVFMRDVRALASGGISSQVDGVRQDAATYYQSTSHTVMWLVTGLTFLVALLGGLYANARVRARFRARNRVERLIRYLLIAAAVVAILTTIGIVLSLIFETLRFFQKVPALDFLFGTHWSPQTAIRPGQVSSEGAFGIIPLLAGTMLITIIAMCVAVPVGLLAAIYLSDYASVRFRAFAKPLLEVLAGIPTVVYGFFAALTVAPLIRGWGEGWGLSIASESALAAGLVMGIMIIPFISSLSDDVINSVPQSLRDGSFGLGATKSETIRQVVLPAALPGIVSSVLLAVSRAIGETMIVVMAAGLAAKPMGNWSQAIAAFNPLEAVTTVTVQIATLLVGDQEFDSAKTLAAFALGFVLFGITLMLNVIALRVVNKYRQQYD